MSNRDINKELLIESIELHLKNNHLDSDSLNVMVEYAPLIHEKLAEAYGMSRGEFRQYVSKRERIEIDELKRAILKTVLSPINPSTRKPYFYDIDQIPVVHVSVQTTGDETVIKYESNDKKLLDKVVSDIDKKVFTTDNPLYP